MEKTISLENDPVFKNAVHLRDNHVRRIDAEQRAETARERICELVLRRKLDAVDLKIIQARDCSPMPTQDETCRIVGIKRRTLRQRIARFQALFSRV